MTSTSLWCFVWMTLMIWQLIAGAGQQNRNIFDLLFENKPVMTADRMSDLLMNAVPGESFPTLATIPETSFNCDTIPPGFYADVDTQCQVFHRCDLRGIKSSFLCVNATIFNQLTLT